MNLCFNIFSCYEVKNLKLCTLKIPPGWLSRHGGVGLDPKDMYPPGFEPPLVRITLAAILPGNESFLCKVGKQSTV